MKFIRQTLSLFSVILFGSIGVVALRVTYQAVRPERPPYTQTDERMVSALSRQVEAWLATLPPSETRAVYGNLGHDDFGFVGGPLRATLWRSGRFDLAPRGLFERLRDRIGWTAPHWASGAEIAAYARSRHAEVAIDGDVLELADGPKPALRVQLEITRPASGEVIAARQFSVEPGTALAGFGVPLTSSLPAELRVLAWIALVLLLPLAVLPFARDLLVDGSNGAICFTLFVLVALDVASAYVLYADRFAGWFGTVLAVAIFGLSLGLNAQYLTWMKEQHA